jgi:hypothetical protein
MNPQIPALDDWPALKVQDWAPTRDTLHMWTQIVGTTRMAHQLLLTIGGRCRCMSARGLTTSAIPHGTKAFDIEFDFLDHQLVIRGSTGSTGTGTLEPKPVADFYIQTMSTLTALGVPTRISARPNEVEPAIPFAHDAEHRCYDAESAHLFWRQLVQADRVLHRFGSYFMGKVSPVHFFWGSMDLAWTRFSGRTAPVHPGGAPNCQDRVMVEGYSHELSSSGFWPGGSVADRDAACWHFSPIRVRRPRLGVVGTAPPRRATPCVGNHPAESTAMQIGFAQAESDHGGQW